MVTQDLQLSSQVVDLAALVEAASAEADLVASAEVSLVEVELVALGNPQIFKA